MQCHGTGDGIFTVDHACMLLPLGPQTHQLQFGTQGLMRRGHTLVAVSGGKDLCLVLLRRRVQNFPDPSGSVGNGEIRS